MDWTDYLPDDGKSSGETEIIVLQPTLELGFAFRKNSFLFIPSIAFGYEWNIKTEGEPTGQGAIVLGGIFIGKSF